MTKKIFFLILFLIIVFFLIYFYYQINTPYKEYPDEKIVKIKKGMNIDSIAVLLENEKIIKNKKVFLITYKIFFRGKNIYAGHFLFSEPKSYIDILEKLTSEYGLLKSITIKEGDSIFEIAEAIQKKGWGEKRIFIKKTKDLVYMIKDFSPESDSLEGYLYPDTYKFSTNEKLESIIKTMVLTFKDKFFPIWYNKPDNYKLSINETITLASLVEKETAKKEERKLISSVYRNRLKRGMLLQCDPTFIYALKKDGKWTGKIGYDEIKYDSPYNTYLYKGLPPGPIANPGLKSIKASIYPADTEYLYFVSKNDGSHHFSKTLKEHNKAVYHYQILSKD